jgi:hypothetical protein
MSLFAFFTRSIVGSAIVTAVLAAASPARAFVLLPGEFNAKSCGSVVSKSAAFDIMKLREVCAGQIIGGDLQVKANAIQLRYNDGTFKTFEVAESSDMLVALQQGRSKVRVYLVGANGEHLTLRLIESLDHQILSASFKMQNVDYVVPQFASIYSMQ